MKRAFTLVEMLIVVALIATLMTIVLKLTAVGADESRRNTTIVRLAKLENCLSGYYAAYGSYPPVRLHNSRDINEPVNDYGVQNTSGGSVNLWGWNAQKFRQDMKSSGYSTQDEEKNAWYQIKAACEAQPVSLEAPDPYLSGGASGLDDAFTALKEIVTANLGKGSYANASEAERNVWRNGFGTIYANLGALDSTATSWRDVQVCKFGLMSFLLPRYQAMMGWSDEMFGKNGQCLYSQWNVNNGLRPHNPFSSGTLSWKNVNDYVLKARGQRGGGSTEDMRKAMAFLEALPSESVTARWLPNLEGACSSDLGGYTFFGVKVVSGSDDGGEMFEVKDGKDASLPKPRVYSPNGSDSSSGLYHLNQITIRDGWEREFFYYSPAPYQTYQIWSAGKNARTFPPWVPLQQLDAKARECVAAWTEDDIKGMSN